MLFKNFVIYLFEADKRSTFFLHIVSNVDRGGYCGMVFFWKQADKQGMCSRRMKAKYGVNRSVAVFGFHLKSSKNCGFFQLKTFFGLRINFWRKPFLHTPNPANSSEYYNNLKNEVV